MLGLLRLLADWDWEAGEAESRQAVELAPGDAYVQWRRGAYLQYAGRMEEAVEAHRRAENLDPLSLVAIEELGWPLYYSRHFEEASNQFRKAIELEPEWAMPRFGLGLVLVHLANHAAAIAELRTAIELNGSNGPARGLNRRRLWPSRESPSHLSVCFHAFSAPRSSTS